MSVYLGVDTSNYTTSVALVNDGEVTENLKLSLPVPPGGRGLRQSDALFWHTKQLPGLFERLGAIRPAAVGFSARPRDVCGSYMPCFLAGESAARAVAAALGVPAYGFSHQAGHIRAAVYSGGREDLFARPFLALHVSGGTTELLFVGGTGGTPAPEITRLGGTLDLNAGQVIDRVGVSAGLSFPCGRELERLAEGFTLPETAAPGAKPDGAAGFDCNLSGLENLARKMKDGGAETGEVAAFVFDYIARTLKKMVVFAMEHSEAVKKAAGTAGIPVLFAGGVMANKIMRSYLSNGLDAAFAEPEYSSDNAAGAALLCRDRHEGK